MNIEEERKAFEKTCEDEHGLITNPWDVWQLAKAHAAEMAKPVYNPEPYNGGWGVQDLQHKYWHTLQTKAQAIEEAKEQGYRVIE